MINRSISTAVALGALAFFAADAAAQQKINLTVAAGQATRAMLPLEMVGTTFIPDVNKRLKDAGNQYEIVWKEAYAGSLLQPLQMLDGVKDGIADIGFTPTIFYPDKLPLENITFMAPFTTTDVRIVSRAINRMHDTFPEFGQQYDKFNQVRLGGDSYDSYELASTFAVRKFEDMRGRKVATAGGALQWLRGTGAVPVQSNMMEYYNSIKTGVYEGCIVFTSSYPGMKYPEVAPFVNKIGFGAQYAAALLMNKDAYRKLPPAVQKVMTDAGRAWGEAADNAMTGAAARGLASVAQFQGAQIVELPRDEQVKWAKAMPNVAKEWAANLDRQGLPGTKALTAYMDALRAQGVRPARDWDKE